MNSFKDPRILTLKNPRKIGVDKTLNIGFKLARGDYICYLDADDELCRDSLLKRYSLIRNSGHALIHGGLTITNEQENTFIKPIKIEDHYELMHFLDVYKPLNSGINSATMMVRADALKNSGLRNTSGQWSGHEDYEFMLRLAYRLNCVTI